MEEMYTILDVNNMYVNYNIMNDIATKTSAQHCKNSKRIVKILQTKRLEITST